MAVKYFHSGVDWTKANLDWSTLIEKGFQYHPQLGLGRVVWVNDFAGDTHVLLAIRTGLFGIGLPPLSPGMQKFKWLIIALFVFGISYLIFKVYEVLR